MRNRRERGDDNWRRLMRATTMIIGIDQKESIAGRCLVGGPQRRRPRRSRHSVRLVGGLWAAALLDYHARQSREHYLILVVEVQHRDLGQFPRRAAWPGIVRWFRQTDDTFAPDPRVRPRDYEYPRHGFPIPRRQERELGVFIILWISKLLRFYIRRILTRFCHKQYKTLKFSLSRDFK